MVEISGMSASPLGLVDSRCLCRRSAACSAHRRVSRQLPGPGQRERSEREKSNASKEREEIFQRSEDSGASRKVAPDDDKVVAVEIRTAPVSVDQQIQNLVSRLQQEGDQAEERALKAEAGKEKYKSEVLRLTAMTERPTMTATRMPPALQRRPLVVQPRPVRYESSQRMLERRFAQDPSARPAPRPRQLTAVDRRRQADEARSAGRKTQRVHSVTHGSNTDVTATQSTSAADFSEAKNASAVNGTPIASREISQALEFMTDHYMAKNSNAEVGEMVQDAVSRDVADAESSETEQTRLQGARRSKAVTNNTFE